MARKINLKGLFDNNNLTVTKINITEDATSDGILALFEKPRIKTDTTPHLSTLRFRANQHSSPSLREQLRLDFSSNIKGRKFRVRITTMVTDEYSIHLNADTSNIQEISGVGSANTVHVNDFDFSVNSLSQIRISLGNSFSNGDHQIFEIELFVLEEAVPFEFNDSVLSTKAWNSTRYDGKQLQASEVNLATIDDTGNNSRTPIIQHYSRNIYLGSRVISMGESLGTDDVDDTSLVNFPGFSYVTVHEFITVHDDLSVSRHSVIGDKPNTNNRFKKSWYQSFYDDFPIGSDISLKFFDEKLETSLDNSYKIFFNAGQLKKLLHVREIDTGSSATDRNFPAHYHTGSHLNRALGAGIVGSVDTTDPGDSLTEGSGHVFFINDSANVDHTFGASFSVFNKESIIDKFFDKSLVADAVAFSIRANQSAFDASK